MKTTSVSGPHIHWSTPLKFTAVICVALLSSFSVLAGGVVGSPTDAALRTAMVGGGAVTFSFDGVITLTNSITIANNTVVDGTGHNVTISGGNAVRLLNVNSGINASFTNITLANGFNVGANGTNGSAATDGEPGQGGAILNNGGAVALVSCVVVSNKVIGGDAGIDSDTLAPFPTGGQGMGGAICSFGGSVTVLASKIVLNTAQGALAPNEGGQAGQGGAACGGALWASNTTIQINGSTFGGNASIGGNEPFSAGSGGTGAGKGGAIFITNGVLTCVGSTFATNAAQAGFAARYGVPGPAQGGAIWSHALLQISQSTFTSNQASGGLGSGPGGGDVTLPGGGEGGGGAIFNNSSLSLNSSLFLGNQALGGGGGAPSGVTHPGGIGRGGAVCNLGTLNVTNCTLIGNLARSGPSAYGTVFTFSAGMYAFGGAFYNTNGIATLVNLTFLSNTVAGGTATTFGGPPKPGPPGPGFGGAICNSNATLNLGNTIVAFNTAEGTNIVASTNYFGSLVDLGHNLNSESPGFPAGPGNLNNTDPVLGPLDNYGGPTLTLPLLSGSPAIDGGFTDFAPNTDQRGRARPYGLASDIGAFESSAPFVIRGRITGFTFQNEVAVVCETTNTMTSQGHYTLWVNATDSNTVTPTNSNYVFFPANQLIATGPDRLNVDFKAYRWDSGSIESSSGGIIRFMFAGTNGQSYRVLFSTDLHNWTAVSTNIPVSSNLFDLVDSSVLSRPAGFYRTVHP
jgi:hypothetical protein